MPGSQQDCDAYFKVRGIDILLNELDTIVSKEKVSQVTNRPEYQ